MNVPAVNLWPFGAVQAEREALPKPQMQVNGVVCKDPFLAALVASDADIAEERFREEARLEEDYSAVEKQLQERAHQTGLYMQKVLELVRVCCLICTAAPAQHRSTTPATLNAKPLCVVPTSSTCFMHADSARSGLIQCHLLLSSSRERRALPCFEWRCTIRPASHRGFQATRAAAPEAAGRRAGGPRAFPAGGRAALQGAALSRTQPLPGPREQAG